MEELIIAQILVYIVSFFGLFTNVFFFITLLEYRKRMKDPLENYKESELPFVSAVMPAFNEAKNIIKTVQSVQALNYPKNKIEIILVDDGSTDNTFEEMKKMAAKDPRIKIFRKENGGAANAKNYGIEQAKGEFIVTLDCDSFVSPDALRNMIVYFRDKKVMAVTPSMTVYNPKGFWQNLQYIEYTFGIFLRKVFGLLNCIHVTPGPFSVYRKSFFDKYGGFDENNLTEDIEIALKIQKNGYKIENSINAPVYTVAPNNFSALMKQRMRWYYGFTKNILKNKYLFKPKYGYLAVLFLPAAFISVALTILVLLYFLYKNSVFVIDKIIQASVTGSDFFAVDLKTIKIKYILEALSGYFVSPFVLFLILGILFTILSLLIAQRAIKTKKSLFLPFIYFAGIYWFFYAVWWICPFIYKLFGGKIKWGLKYY